MRVSASVELLDDPTPPTSDDTTPSKSPGVPPAMAWFPANVVPHSTRAAAQAATSDEPNPRRMASFSIASVREPSTSKRERSEANVNALQAAKSLKILVSNLLDSATVTVDNNANGLQNSGGNFSRIIAALGSPGGQASLRLRRPSELKSSPALSPASKPPLVRQSSSEQEATLSPAPPALGGYALNAEETIASLVTLIYEFHTAAMSAIETLISNIQRADDSNSSHAPQPRQHPYLSIDELESLTTSSSLPKNFLQSLRTALNSSSSSASATTHHFLVSLPAPSALSDGEGASIVELPFVPSLETSHHMLRPLPITSNTQPPSQGHSTRSSPPAIGMPNGQSFEVSTVASTASQLPSPPDQGLLTAKPSVIAPHAPGAPMPHDTPRRAVSYDNNSTASKLSPPSFAMPPPVLANFPESTLDHNGAISSIPLMLTKSASRGADPSGLMKTLNQYTLVTEIGRGSQGKVFLAVDSNTSRTVAIKSLARKKRNATADREGGDSPNESLRHDAVVVKSMRHKNVISVCEVIDDPSECQVYVVMQYADKGSIATVGLDGSCTPRPKSFIQILDIAFQAAQGLRYLHRKRIIHHDIKPKNLLWDSEGNIMLTDFGVAEFRCDYTILGNDDADVKAVEILSDYRDHNKSPHVPLFTAPEVLATSEANGSGQMDEFGVLAAADVWSLGATMAAICTGRVPFLPPPKSSLQFKDETLFADFANLIKDSVARGDLRPLLYSGTSACHQIDEVCACREVRDNWGDLLTKMLDLNPSMRPSAASVTSTIAELLSRVQDENLLSGTCRQTVLASKKHQMDTSITPKASLRVTTAISVSSVVISPHSTKSAAKAYGDAVINKTSFRLLKKE